jgi:hypothetical protein
MSLGDKRKILMLPSAKSGKDKLHGSIFKHLDWKRIKPIKIT